MPSTSYGRGGGGNFNKTPKEKKPKPTSSDTTTSTKSNQKTSLLKKIVHALPSGAPPKSPKPSALRHTQTIDPCTPWEGYTGPLSSFTVNEPTSFPPAIARVPIIKPIPPYRPPILNLSKQHIIPAINLNSITPTSSDDESEESERTASRMSIRDNLPCPSPNTMTDNEGTAVNDPISPVSDTSEDFDPPPVRTRRLRSMSNAPRMVHFRADSIHLSPGKDEKASEVKYHSSEEKPTAKNTGSADEGKYKRVRRMTLSSVPASTPIIRPQASRPKLSVDPQHHSHTHTHSNCCNESTDAVKPTPPSESFNNFIASCALSLLLLLVLTAGKNVLYMIALLPVLIALGKHPSFTRKNIESLITF
ncbi:hypothetical protein M408DRAFT_329842 [Serendipita vermifera MAFF 305830]|uniref:Uncharacterized protein n=1 Tax=Serendipita vermifera MAFF 305830 TaxID=933852 RepID=A0A0C2XFR1_SERVB|nr:hypothetical protein M408DRAFT_329842 [Serendipita vermifera MAFF 305830]